MLKQYFSDQNKRFQQFSFLMAIIVVAGVGTYLLTLSHAAAPFASITADKGALAGGAASQTCVGASDGNCVVFGGTIKSASCTTILSPSSSLQSALDGASAGSVICLNPGTYSAPTITKGGTAAAPITLTSANTANPALISGRTVVEHGASYVTISHLKFKWIVNNGVDVTVSLSTPHVNFVHNDVDGSDGSICLTGSNYSDGIFSYNLIDHNNIHNCNGIASGNEPNQAQGLYLEGGPGDVITNNWCWAVSARCFQIRAEHDSVWHNNVSDNSGQGFIFGGDAGPSNNNNVYNNIVGSVVGNDLNPGYSALDYQTSNSSGNTFHDNCVSIPAGPFQTTVQSNNTVVKVQFVDAANHNYNLSAASINDPCRAFAVQGGNPGP